MSGGIDSMGQKTPQTIQDGNIIPNPTTNAYTLSLITDAINNPNVIPETP
jgi:hypothetical protein